MKEYEDFARKNMIKMVYDYYAGGSWDEVTLRRNIKVEYSFDGWILTKIEKQFEKIEIVPRLFGGVDVVDTKTTVLGKLLKD